MIPDEVQVVLIALAWSGAVGIAGLAAARLLRGLSVRVRSVGAAVLAVACVVAGVLGTARAMFFSDHDRGVVLVVAGVAGTVAVLVAWAASSATARWSRELAADARDLADPDRALADRPGRAPAELQRLSDELRRTDARLRESRRREQRLEESRRELVSWVSHDLRTPLAGMRAMAEALEDGMVDDPARYHRRIRDDVDRMVTMVDDLFELSRISAGSLVLDREAVPCADLVSEAVAAAEPVAAAQGLVLAGSADPGLEVAGDARALTRVLANLVDNALRHSAPGGRVAVAATGARTAEGERALVRVTDACGGIPAHQRDRVFEVGWQADPSRGGGHGGAGVGLSIVRGLVEAHGGTVSVEDAPGGCCFVVDLPRR